MDYNDYSIVIFDILEFFDSTFGYIGTHYDQR